MALTNISISKAENGCTVRCEYEDEREVPATRKGDQPYTTKDYSTKTYVATHDLLEMIMDNVGEEIDEPVKKGIKVVRRTK